MVDIHELSFGYSAKKMLYKGLTVQMEAGSIYGLLGKNGAGKSTLLKNLAGMLFPSSGYIRINGRSPRHRSPAFLQAMYLIPEEVHVPALSVRRYMDLFSPFYPRFDKTAFENYLQQLEVTETGRLNKLSFGQQKKFIIAFALACNTDVLLLDEPTNGLDIPSKIRFRKLIASLFTENRIIIISTHQIRDLDHLIDRVVIVDRGELLLNASIVDIAAKLSFKMVANLDDADQVLYAEQSLQGFAVVAPNIQQEQSKVNLEHLFNAVTENPSEIKKLFQ